MNRDVFYFVNKYIQILTHCLETNTCETCLSFSLDTSFLQNLSTKPHLLKTANSNPSAEHESKITNNNNDTVKVDRFLELHMKNILFPVPPIKTAATGCEGSEHFLPEHVQLVKEMDKTEIKALVRLVLFILFSTEDERSLYRLSSSSMSAMVIFLALVYSVTARISSFISRHLCCIAIVT